MTDQDHVDELGQPEKSKPFNFKEIERFGWTGLSVEDMAVILNMKASRIRKLMENPKSKFYFHYRRGQALVRLQLQSHQIATALGKEKGNAALLTHLGVHMLGQQTAGKKQVEEPEVTAEQLLQNATQSQKAEMLNVLMNITHETTEVDDGDSK